MLRHTCHLPGCHAVCPERHLFCSKHWAMVPDTLQADVYRTVKLRGECVDQTWAPWWRAQAAATRAVLDQLYPDDPRTACWYERELQFAETLKRKADD